MTTAYPCIEIVRYYLCAERKKTIANSINAYNLLWLSEKLLLTGSIEDRNILLNKITQTSTQRWAHINLAGEYDFSYATEYKRFDFDALMRFRLTPAN